MSIRKFLIASVAAAGLSTCLLLSCLEGFDGAIFTCSHYVMGHLDSLGHLDPCCADKSVPCLRECDGECQPKIPSSYWQAEPVLLWYGLPSNAPPEARCPNGMEGTTLYSDPLPSYDCLRCRCEAPACVLPSGMIASDTGMCQGPVFTSFPATDPSGCSTPIEIQPNTAKSLSLLAPTVEPCVPKVDIGVPRDFPISPPWARQALVCSDEGTGVCPPDHACMAALPSAPPGYMYCIAIDPQIEETMPCPESYPHPLTLYKVLDNDASCTPCQCDPPVGSECTAQVSAFTDSSCVDISAIFKDYLVPLGPPECVPVPVNTGVRGMMEKWLINQPGQCSPKGGDPTGTPVPNRETARSYCCEQDPAANF